jgi:Zn-dependent protease
MGNFQITPEMILFLPALWLAVICHEIGHAYAAFKAGDDTASLQGRLSLNPLAHIDPIGTVLIPIVMMLSPIRLPLIGWAKPVPVNPMRFKSRIWNIYVSLAGVAVNFALCVTAMLLIKILLLSGLLDRVPTSDGGFTIPELILLLLRAFVMINVILFMFNLIPIPPLDGSHVVLYFIRTRDSVAFKLFQFMERFGFMILILLIWTGVVGLIFGPFLNTTIGILCFLFGVPRHIFPWFS